MRPIILVAVLVLAGGCANQKSNQVVIRPEVTTTTENIVKGLPLGIRVTDVRKDKNLGTAPSVTGGRIELRNDQDIASLVYGELANGLSRKGFKVGPLQEDDQRTLDVKLKQLDYASSGSVGRYKLAVRAELDVSGKTTTKAYSTSYGVTKEEGAYMPNDGEDNQRLVSAALSNVIEQLVNDPELLLLLAK